MPREESGIALVRVPMFTVVLTLYAQPQPPSLSG
jgi:hypothetical protein